MTVGSKSELVNYLPAIYREDPFAADFLKAFEKILIGREDGGASSPEGLEETLNRLASCFDPAEAPVEFLSWLADWTAFTMRADFPEQRQRDFLARVISLYARRGTKENLQTLLGIFIAGEASEDPEIMEEDGLDFQLDEDLQLGVNTYLGGGPPHFFRVTLSLDKTTEFMLDRLQNIASSIIELEKPAHTHYRLDVIFPSMQVGVHCTIGVDTILGTEM